MFKDLVLADRSYRGYKPEKRFTKEELLELIDYARLCPASSNKQPLKFCPVWQEDLVPRIQAQTKWAMQLPELHLPYPGQEPTAFIIVCHDTDVVPYHEHYRVDVGITSHTILLAATERGLGGCMIGCFNPKEISRILSLPENILPMLVLALGEPNESISLVDLENGESTAYYRDENGNHYVPKRRLKDIIL